jgi:hypothetical protein
MAVTFRPARRAGHLRAASPGRVPGPPGEWNAYLIDTAGPKIGVTLNGLLINDYTSTRQQSGFLALQVHSFPSKIEFRNLQAK